MPRVKKSRKIGSIGVANSTEKPQRTSSSNKPKKKTGKKSGSRNNHEQNPSAKQSSTNSLVDKRLGSKKPIDLLAQKVTTPKVKYFSPAEELEAIENDKKLSKLLLKEDEGKKLSTLEKQFVDERVARHKALCEMLGINLEDDDDDLADTSEEDSLFDRLESNLDQFKS